MKYTLAVIIPFLPLLAGCIAYGSDQAHAANMVDVNLKTLLVVYGPMAGIIIWFMFQEKRQDERLFKLVQSVTEAMIKIESSLNQSCASDEKTRTAIYKNIDEMKSVLIKVESLADKISSSRISR